MSLLATIFPCRPIQFFTNTKKKEKKKCAVYIYAVLWFLWKDCPRIIFVPTKDDDDGDLILLLYPSAATIISRITTPTINITTTDTTAKWISSYNSPKIRNGQQSISDCHSFSCNLVLFKTSHGILFSNKFPFCFIITTF